MKNFLTLFLSLAMPVMSIADVIECTSQNRIPATLKYQTIFTGNSDDYVNCDSEKISSHLHSIQVSSASDGFSIKFKVALDGVHYADCSKISIDKFGYESENYFTNFKSLEFINNEQLYKLAKEKVIGQCHIDLDINYGHAIASIKRLRRGDTRYPIETLVQRTALSDKKELVLAEQKAVGQELRALIEEGKCGKIDSKIKKTRLSKELLTLIVLNKDRALVEKINKDYNIVNIIANNLAQNTNYNEILEGKITTEEIFQAVKSRLQPELIMAVKPGVKCSIYEDNQDYYRYQAYDYLGKQVYRSDDLENARSHLEKECVSGSVFYERMYKTYHFPAHHFVKAGILAAQLKQIGITLFELKNSVSVQELKNIGYTLPELQNVFSFNDLKDVFPLEELSQTSAFAKEIVENFSTKDVMSVIKASQPLNLALMKALSDKVGLKEIVDSGYDIDVLKAAGIGIDKLKVHFPLTKLAKEYGPDELGKVYTFDELKTVFSLEKLAAGTAFIKEILETYSTQEVISVLKSNKILNSSLLRGLTNKIGVAQIKESGFSLEELKNAAIRIDKLKPHYSINEISKAYSLKELVYYYNLHELGVAYPLSILASEPRISVEDLKQTYSLKELKESKGIKLDRLSTAYSVKELLKEYPVEELMRSGITTLKRLVQTEPDPKIRSEIIHYLIDVASKYSNSDYESSLESKKSCIYFINWGNREQNRFVVTDEFGKKKRGYPSSQEAIADLKNCRSLRQAKEAGLTASDFRAAGIEAKKLKDSFKLYELKEAYPLEDFVTLYSKSSLLTVGYTKKEIRQATRKAKRAKKNEEAK